jgi:hypothetical protein
MCTTDRHEVRAGPPLVVGDGLSADGLLVPVPDDCEPEEAEVGDSSVLAAGLGDGFTTPARPQLASATTRKAATAAAQVRRPASPSRHPVDLI